MASAALGRGEMGLGGVRESEVALCIIETMTCQSPLG